MATRLNSWSFGGGRWNAATAWEGASGLRYIVETIGSGRTCGQWGLYIFPPGTRFSNYQGAGSVDRIAPLDRCLFHAEGSGGFDTGKGFSAKGGYREGGAIPYTYAGTTFDGAMLQEPDRFVREVLGWETTVQGIKDGIQQVAKADAERKEAQRMADWRAEQTAKRQAYETNVSAQQAIFGEEPQVPEGWVGRVEANGLHVFQWHNGSRWSEKIFATVEAYQQWYEATTAEIAAKKQAETERLAAKAKADVQKAAYREQVRAAMPEIKAKLAQL